MGPCHVHMDARAHHRPGRIAVRVPGIHRRAGDCPPGTSTIDATPGGNSPEKFDRLHPWKECGDCAFIPACAGGCVAASHTQLGDMNMPTCHKPSFESALFALAHDSPTRLTGDYNEDQGCQERVEQAAERILRHVDRRSADEQEVTDAPAARRDCARWRLALVVIGPRQPAAKPGESRCG